MSSFIRCCFAITFLTVTACGPRASESPRHPSAEARNVETEKKPRKQRQPVVAPPPAYGNKIVRAGAAPERNVAAATDGDVASAAGAGRF